MTNLTDKLRKVLIHPVAKRLAVAAPISVGVNLELHTPDASYRALVNPCQWIHAA